jgi:hypothetical protein
MNIPEFEALKENPTKKTAMEFGRAMTKSDISVEDKRMIFGQAFSIVEVEDELEAIINMWTIGAMIEASLPIPQKIEAVRGFLKDPKITPELIEEWTDLVFDASRAPKDLLDFIAIDIRNCKGISTALRRRLGHPNPENPTSG